MVGITQREFLDKQYKVIQDIINGDTTLTQLNDLRADYYGVREHRDTTAKGCKIIKEYIDNGWHLYSSQDDSSKCTNEESNHNKTITISNNGNQTSENRIRVDNTDQLKDKKFLLEAHGYDPNQWELINSKSSMWDSKPDGRLMYSSKISVKPKVCGIDAKEVVKFFNENLVDIPRTTYIPMQYKSGAECFVPCLFDVHFSKLASYDETQNVYNYEIASERFLDTIQYYADKVIGRQFDKVLFPIGNDFFNAEASGDTYNHTRQDNDLRYGDMFKKGVETLIAAIDILKNIAPIKVILVQGNHDYVTSFYASCVLDAYYKNDENVTVDNSPTTRKYEKFGANLLGFTHGSEEKDRIYTLMQNEAPNLWGETKYREWIIGHKHHESVREKAGVVIRTMPTITGIDAWHYKKGYVSSGARSMAFIYDKEKGLNEILYKSV